jgi:hypothetical protein
LTKRSPIQRSLVVEGSSWGLPIVPIPAGIQEGKIVLYQTISNPSMIASSITRPRGNPATPYREMLAVEVIL